ncbi:expressed protein [Phakopsora pachyrhizi]|uniref:Expressed protein n=1 Tax=Phakopsora pachyrhizi TaxID=170000 RepID=A0AAV0BCH9_PHAPC|nr:expressed protein [Phakopsora pachyrhizi]
MAKILLQSILITIWLNSCVRSMEWAELPKVSNQVKVASSSSMSKNNPIAHELEESDHFSTDSSTRSLILKDKYFGDELRKIQKEIQDLSFIGHGYLKIKLNRMQNLIGRILKVPGEHNYGENSSLDSKKNPDNIRDEILAEVREVLFEFDNLPNEPWDAGLSEKWAIMSGILRVLDPFIKHGFFSTEQTQLWFKDLKILQVSAYVLSNELYLSLRYWLPSIESLSKLSRKEFVWLSTLKGQEVKFFLRQLIGFSYTNASSKISYPRLLPVVNLFLENSEVTENTFTTFQLYAPTEVVKGKDQIHGLENDVSFVFNWASNIYLTKNDPKYFPFFP